MLLHLSCFLWGHGSPYPYCVCKISLKARQNITRITIFVTNYIHNIIGGNLDLAWKYLEEGHRIDRMTKTDKVSSADLLSGAENIKKIFTTGFWPAGLGSPSNVPVFIVGMMRWVRDGRLLSVRKSENPME